MSLRLVPSDATLLAPEDASRQAWTHILHGFRAALETEGLSAKEHKAMENAVDSIVKGHLAE